MLAWESQFNKPRELLKLVIQYSPGFRQLKFQENKQPEMLRQLRLFFIEKIEELYEKLTGINIQKLIDRAGGDLKSPELKSVSTAPVSTIATLKTVNLSPNLKPSAIKSLYPRQIKSKRLKK